MISDFIFKKRLGSDLHILENRNKRRRFASDLFLPITNHDLDIETAKKAHSNFSSPSPDDRVLDAQKAAFEEGVKNLKISSTPEPKEKAAKSTAPFKKTDLAKELSNSNYLKPHKSFVVIGHVDAGKSTLMGRILYDVGAVDAKTVNKLVREAEKSGKGSFALAWVMDQTSEERARGVTVDICATNFETTTTRFTAIDAPGHKDFVPQMIGGVSQADFAVLVVDSINGEFEAGFTMDGQTKEHTLLAKSLGIEQICVVVNKMDKENWSEDRFADISSQLTAFLTSEDVGFSAKNLTFIPISGLNGQNVVKNENHIPEFQWYKGPTLMGHLENVQLTETRARSVPQLLCEDFNLAINDIFDVSSSEFGVTGKVSSGLIQPGETVRISPLNDFVQVQSIKLGDKPVDVAISGEIVLLTFKIGQLSNKTTDDLSIGDLVLKIDSPIQAVEKFTASISLFNMNKPLLVGTPFVLFRNNSFVPARISKILEILEAGKKKKKMHLVSKQSATVEIEVQGDRKLSVTRFEDNKTLGRVVIRREGVTVGAGKIVEVAEAKK